MKIKDWIDEHPIVKYWDPIYIILIIIVFFSLIPKPFAAVGIPAGESLNFNHLHILAYFTLSFALGLAFKNSKIKRIGQNSYALAILISLLISTLIEIAQFFIPGRYMDVNDIFFNAYGIIPAQILLYLLSKYFTKNRSFLKF